METTIPDNLPDEWTTPLIECLLYHNCLEYPPGRYRRLPCDIPGERQHCGHRIPAGNLYYVSTHFMFTGRRLCLPCASKAMSIRPGREVHATTIISFQLEQKAVYDRKTTP